MPKPEPLLLDTHVWIWFASGNERQLEARTVERIRAAGRAGRLYLAAISLWEVAMLAAKGRVVLAPDTESWLLEAILHSRVSMVPIDAAIAAKSCALELAHADPADRMIVASALDAGAVLLTADETILQAARRLGLRAARP